MPDGVYRLVMKWILLLLCGLVCGVARPQSVQKKPAVLTNAFETRLLASAEQSPAAQIKNWKAETQKDPRNQFAWLNYYLWTERDKALPATEKAQRLQQIFADAQTTTINGSDAFNVMAYLKSGKKDSASLYKALEKRGDKSWVYPYVIQHAIITQNKKALMQYAGELEATDPLIPALYEYHYNVLLSADSNATIYAQGVNDLVPLAVLQQAHGVRKDVRLKYYNGTIADKANSFLCLSAGKEILAEYPTASYQGLLIKLNGTTNPETIKNIVEGFQLQLVSTGSFTVETALLNKNYLPSFLLLYHYLKKTNDASAERWQALILKIAESAGITDAVLNQLKN